MAAPVSCRLCGEESPPGAQYCSNCRSRLSEDNIVTGKAAQEQRIAQSRSKRTRRIIILTTTIGLLLLLGTWLAYKNFSAPRFLPSPSSNITAESISGTWPMVRGNPAHTGYLDGDGPDLIGQIRWRLDTDSPIFSSPAVVGNHLYLTTGDKRILALNAVSGDLLWEYNVTGPINSSPAIAAQFLFVGLRDGTIISLDRNTGEKQWEFETNNPVHSSPAVHKGIVYVGSMDGNLYALDAITGEERWSYLTGGRITSDPAINYEVAAVTSQDLYLYLIDLDTGERRLDFRTTRVGGSPAFHQDLMFFIDESGRLMAIDWQQQERFFEKTIRRLRTQLFVLGLANSLPFREILVWSTKEPAVNMIGTPAIANEILYAGSASGTVLAFNEHTGETLWQFMGAGGITTSPSVAGRSVFIGDDEGHLYSLDSLTGDLLWKFTAGSPISSDPVISNDTLYAVTKGGTLYAIE